MTTRPCVFSEQVGGGDRFYLDALGRISGLRYSKTYPGGALTASWQMNLDPRAQHRAWAPGRQIGLTAGAGVVWTGLLDNPTRGTVWQMNAIGSAADAKRFLSDSSDGDALNLTKAYPAAVARGLAWNLPGGYPSLPTTTVPSGSIYLDDATQQVLTGQTATTYWRLDNELNLTFESAPSVPTYVLLATGVGGGRTLDGFVTDVTVLYQAASGLIATITVSAASRPFGRFEGSLDVTGLGLIPTSQAISAGQAYLTQNGARAKYTDPFTITHGQLLTIGGQPVDLALFNPGSAFNVIVTDPDSAGEVSLAPLVTCVGGVTDYDVDSGVLTLGTTDSSSDSLSEALFADAA